MTRRCRRIQGRSRSATAATPGRLVGEDYVACEEALTTNEDSDEFVGLGGDDYITSYNKLDALEQVDVRYFFDAYPSPAGTGLTPPSGAAALAHGRATASSDQGQRSLVAYDTRGTATWSARQIALIGEAAPIASTIADPMAPLTESDETPRSVRTLDTVHTYVRTSKFDYANRPISMTLPTDPDFVVARRASSAGCCYNWRGLPDRAAVTIGGNSTDIVQATTFRPDGLPSQIYHGGPRA